MKRILSAALAVLSILMLASCGNREENAVPSKSVITPLPVSQSVTAPTGIPEATQPRETETPKAEPTKEGELTSGIGFVTTSELNVRQGPSTSANVIGKLPLNKRIEVLQKDEGHGWSKINYDGKEAYIANRYVEIVGEGSVGTATVATDDLNMRSQPLPDAEVLGKLSKGTKLEVYVADAGEGWTLAAYDDRLVYVATRYLDMQQ